MRHCIDAFVFYKGPGGAAEEFGNISYWVNVIKTADYVAQTAIGDSILVSTTREIYGKFGIKTVLDIVWQIFRFYIIHEKSWRMTIIPIVLWAATLGMFYSVSRDILCSI